MGKNFVKISLRKLVDTYGWNYTSTGKTNCPFCGGKKKLQLDLDRDLWNCVRCRTGGTTLDLFAMYSRGYKSKPREKDEMHQLGLEMVDYCGDSSLLDATQPHPVPSRQPRQPQQPQTRLPASDEHLDKAYSFILSQPEMALSLEHTAELLRRGLTEKDLEVNGYGTLTEFAVNEPLMEVFNACGGNEQKSKLFSFPYPTKRLLTGMEIARRLQEAGLSPEGVPGFFKFGNDQNWCWCLYFYPGIMIPTRNRDGQIVSIQVRTNIPKMPKYMTLSSSNLPGAVNASISRCHFCRQNPSLEKGTPVLVTEGALKADVALSLSGGKAAIISIPGICNTKDLFAQVSYLKSKQVTVYNAFDMDRFTNPNVRAGVEEIKRHFLLDGLPMVSLHWGADCARRKMAEYLPLAALNKIPVNWHDISYHALYDLASTIFSCHLSYTKDYWDDNSKGIDDALLSHQTFSV